MCERYTPIHTVEVAELNIGKPKEYGTCIGVDVTLKGESSNATSWQWEDIDGNVLNTFDKEFTVTNPTENAVYYFVAFLTTDVGTCSNKQEHTVNVYDLQVQVDSSAITPFVCPGEQVLLVADTTGTGAMVKNFSVRWEKMSEETLVPKLISSNMTTKDRPTVNTIYTVKVSNGGCVKEDSYEVVMHPVPTIVEVLTDQIGPKEAQIEVVGGTHFYAYAIDDSTDFYSSKNFEYLTIGHHIAYVKDENGCMDSRDFYIDEVSLGDFQKYFSPNGDGLLDRFEIPNLRFYSKFQLRIYDRFGQELVLIDDPTTPWWDGMVDNKLQKSDDYWYVLYVNETRKSYVGHITLMNLKK
jgi:gliding motility-associated-like protein